MGGIEGDKEGKKGDRMGQKGDAMIHAREYIDHTSILTHADALGTHFESSSSPERGLGCTLRPDNRVREQRWKKACLHLLTRRKR